MSAAVTVNPTNGTAPTLLTSVRPAYVYNALTKLPTTARQPHPLGTGRIIWGLPLLGGVTLVAKF